MAIDDRRSRCRQDDTKRVRDEIRDDERIQVCMQVVRYFLDKYTVLNSKSPPLVLLFCLTVAKLKRRVAHPRPWLAAFE